MVERIYSERDQKLLDDAQSAIDEHSKHLLSKLESMTLTDQQKQKMFLEDPVRNKLIENLTKLHMVLMPEQIVYTITG